LLTDAEAARRLAGLGLTPEQAQQQLADEFAAVQARRRVSG
jgi:hypothetical protein